MQRTIARDRVQVASWLVVLLSLGVPSAHALGPAPFTTHHDTIPNFAQDHTIQSARELYSNVVDG